ncbi:MAG: biotin synthase BioB [Gammaproteobacteria bacterium]|jgi:biotin synthase
MSAQASIDQDQPRYTALRHDWAREEVRGLLELPFSDLLYRAHTAHRHWFDPNEIQLSTLLNIKTGGCPEDCGYCPQSARYQTGVGSHDMLGREEVLRAAQAARERGATRFCMGAAWRNPKEKDFARVLELVEAVKGLGMESCATLGMLTPEQATRLREAGLDYYNHNLDTSPEYYGEVISTRDYEDRLNTLRHVRAADIRVCCGGIIGMGEDMTDRAGLLQTLANLDPHPESVPINLLVRVQGTPLGKSEAIDPLDMVRTVAAARILMPASWVRLSAGRSGMEDGIQALCYFAGANSVFFGEKLLTTENPQQDKDLALFARLGLTLRR